YFLALVRPDADRLFEPALRQRVVFARDAELGIDHPLDAHDVQSDPIDLLDGQVDAGDIRDLVDELFVAGKRRRVEKLRGEAAHADRIADGEDIFASAHRDFFSVVAVRLGRDIAAVQLALESGVIVDLR